MFFDNFATIYNQNCWVQSHFANVLLASSIPVQYLQGNILDIGCGTGLLAQKLITQFNVKSTNIYQLDPSPQMCKIASKHNPAGVRCGQAEGIATIFKGVHFELIISSMALQWCNLPIALPEIASICDYQTGVLLMLPIFGSFAELADRHQFEFKNIFHPFTSQMQLENLVGKHLPHCKITIHNITLTYPSFAAFLKQMHKTGAKRHSTTSAFTSIKKLCSYYPDTFSTNWKLAVISSKNIGLTF